MSRISGLFFSSKSFTTYCVTLYNFLGDTRCQTNVTCACLLVRLQTESSITRAIIAARSVDAYLVTSTVVSQTLVYICEIQKLCFKHLLWRVIAPSDTWQYTESTCRKCSKIFHHFFAIHRLIFKHLTFSFCKFIFSPVALPSYISINYDTFFINPLSVQ